jgi:uncharacterized integral membrane protein
MTALLQIVWRIFRQVARVAIFLLLFLLATINSESVPFHWFVDRTSVIPLNILLLSAFLCGLGIAIVALKFPKIK